MIAEINVYAGTKYSQEILGIPGPQKSPKIWANRPKKSPVRSP